MDTVKKLFHLKNQLILIFEIYRIFAVCVIKSALQNVFGAFICTQYNAVRRSDIDLRSIIPHKLSFNPLYRAVGNDSCLKRDTLLYHIPLLAALSPTRVTRPLDTRTSLFRVFPGVQITLLT